MPRSDNSAAIPARASRFRSILLVAGFLVLLAVQAFPPRWGALGMLTYFDAQAALAALHDDETRLPDAMRALVRDARAWRAEFAPVLAQALQLHRVPYFGGDLQNVLQMAAAFDETLNAVEPTLLLYEKLTPQWKAQPAGAALVAFAQNNAAAVDNARTALQKARVKVNAVETRRLSAQTHALLTRVQEWFDGWDAVLRLLKRAPVLLGRDAPKKYLVLAQNNDELRATGGFITAVGVVQVNAGAIYVEWFGDSLSADNLNLIHSPPPEPLQKYMWASQWLLRDANWYANFPTSADLAISMYARDHGVRTEGVIAVDLRFMPLLVQAIPELELDGVKWTRANVIDEIKANWKPLPQSDAMTGEWFASNRKVFLGDLMRAMMARLQSGEIHAAGLAQAMLQGLASKSVQIYLADEDAEQAVLLAGWGGAVETGRADYLNVIDSNVGFNKVNARVTREILYHVRLNEYGGDATVKMIYHNPSRPETDACDLLRQHKDTTYVSMEHSCYWNYVRVLTPRFTQFYSAQGVSDAGYAQDIDAVTALGGYLIVKRNSDAHVEFRYALPDTILQDNAYSLQLQTQAGAVATPVRVRIEYPSAWKIYGTTDAFQRIDDTTIELQDTLARDKQLTVYFDR